MTAEEMSHVERVLADICTQFEVHESIQSTNTRALQLADEGAPHGTVVWSDQQTDGRGRRGRDWYSPPSQNVYLSVILRPELPALRAPQFTLDAACAVADALEQHVNIPGLRLKWPNDIVIVTSCEEQVFLKLGGILTELRTNDNMIDALVVGVGINVGRMAETPVRQIAVGLLDLDPDLCGERDRSPTSFRAHLTGSIVDGLIKRSDAFQIRRQFDRPAWLARALSFGREVQVSIPGMTAFNATTVDLDESGQLRVRRGNEIKVIVGGEVSF